MIFHMCMSTVNLTIMSFDCDRVYTYTSWVVELFQRIRTSFFLLRKSSFLWHGLAMNLFLKPGYESCRSLQKTRISRFQSVMRPRLPEYCFDPKEKVKLIIFWKKKKCFNYFANKIIIFHNEYSFNIISLFHQTAF